MTALLLSAFFGAPFLARRTQALRARCGPGAARRASDRAHGRHSHFG